MKNYNTLILSGGGIKGFGILGSLQYLEHNNKLKNFNKIIGTSIGGIIGYLLVLGFQPVDIVIQCIQENYFQKVKKINILRGIIGNGFLDFDIFKTILKDFSYKKFEKEELPTFKELYEYNPIDLKMITYNYTINEEEILSKDTTPDLSILDAARMTSNIPFVFGHYKYKDNYYFDGFITSNFPLHLINKENDISIGICCIRNRWKEDKELKTYKVIWNLFILPFFKIQTLRNQSYKDYVDIFNIPFEDIPFLDFRISNKQILDMYSIGYSNLKTFFSNNMEN